MLALSSVVINSASLCSKSRTRSTTRPSRVEVDKTNEPVAEISSAGVIIAVRNSMVEFSAFGLTLIKSEAISDLGLTIWDCGFETSDFKSIFLRSFFRLFHLKLKSYD